MDNMANNKYVSLKKGLSGYASLVKADEVLDIIGNDSTGINTDWYQSVFYYNDEHLKHHKEKGNLRGITNVKTDKLVIDFDDASNPNNARVDAVELTKRLKSQGVKEKDIEIYFSGNKGFHVIVTLKKEITPRQAELAANKLTKDLKTFDSSLYDAAQILRVPWTKNKSGLYKVPITSEQLNTTIDKIKEIAKDINNVDETKFHWQATDAITDDFFAEPVVKEKKEKTVSMLNTNFDLTNKPKHWIDVKWALLNAYMVKSEERHESLMRIAATCRGLGYTQDMAKALCETFDTKFVENTKKPPVEDLETNILSTVYSDKWNGGQYSIKTDSFLQQYALRIGIKLEETNMSTLDIDSVFTEFEDFSENFEQNIIKTGISELDDHALFLTSTHNGILGQPGSGKCLGKDTPIIMYDGTIKKVQDIVTGDLLMGDDSTPRKVLGTTIGRDTLYKIKQRNGDDYIVNSCHILSLKGSSNDNGRTSYKKIHDINLQEYIKENNNFKKRVKGYKVAVEFAEKEQEINPYFLGYWLGNGTAVKTQLTINSDHTEVANWLKKYSQSLNLNFITRNQKGKGLSIELNVDRGSGKNHLRTSLMNLNVFNNKHIPHNYLTGSRKQRLALLAGLIDSDGHCDKSGDYEIIQKRKELADGIVFLCRSLGYKTSIKKVTKRCQNFEGQYYRINIMSDDFSELPLLLDYKKLNKIERQRYYDLTEIEVEKLEEGEYYGFEIDGNKRFLLGDFTVTHNTSFVIQWLEHLSENNQHCFFYSLDMAESIVGAKLVQRVTGLPFKEATRLKRTNPKEYQKAKDLIKEKFKNVTFVFNAGTTVEKIKETIFNYEETTGNKVRFLCIDYLECLQGPYSDQTANTGFISNQLKDLARETKVCSVILLQTQKSTGGGDVSEPILSMKKIKGSSVIEQSASVLLTLWREGYSPKFQQFDKYMSFGIVKNRFGTLWTDDFSWRGATGHIGNVLGDEERLLLKQLREEKAKAKAQLAEADKDWE